jgi:hypothetical protein
MKLAASSWNKNERAKLSMTKPKTIKYGELMNKLYVTALLTLTCLCGLVAKARAQDPERVVVKVPFEFVAGEVTMPAGTYSVGRIFSDSHWGLVISSYDKTVMVPTPLVETASAQQLGLSFEHVEDKYFLSKVETPGGIYTVPVPRAISALVQARDHSSVSASGSN